MRAAILWSRHADLAIDHLELPDPLPGEAVVRIVASGVCHSDLVQIKRETRHQPPLVLGHECAGIVEEIGAGVTRVRPTDRVLIAFGMHCGECFYCIRGESALCEAPVRERPRRHASGRPVRPLYGVGGFAERTVVDERNLVVIPDGVPMDSAALVACSVTTGLGAVIRRARVIPGASVAVIGVGAVGLNIVQGARLAGAARIIAVDLFDRKLEWAREFGATHVLNATREDPVEGIRRLTGGRGVEYAFEAVGSERTVGQAYDATRKGGAVIIVGMAPLGVLVPVSALDIMSASKALLGCTYGSCARPAHDFTTYFELYREGRIKLDELISRRFGLDEINDAFTALESGEVARSVVLLE